MVKRTLLGVLGLLVWVAPAGAEEVTIGFDDLAQGARPRGHYGSQGVTFSVQGLSNPMVIEQGTASSPPNVLSLRDPDCTGEFCSAVSVATLTSAARRVAVQIGSRANQGTYSAELKVYGAGPEVLGQASVTITAGAAPVPLEVALDTASIWRFEIAGSRYSHAFIDDLRIERPDGPRTADFTWAHATPEPVSLDAGGETVTKKLFVQRLGASHGAITFSAVDLPPGVTVSFSPTAASGADQQEIEVRFTAGLFAPPVRTKMVTISGQPAPTAGSAPRSTTVSVTVREQYDARIVGVEVTQGSQVWALPPNGGALSDATTRLVAGRKTVVRVFANLRVAPASGSVAGVTALLSICDRAGNNCRESIAAEQSALTLTAGPAAVSNVERGAGQQAFLFVLPPERTRGAIGLRADLGLEQPSPFSSSRDCRSAECAANHRYVVREVLFQELSYGLTVVPIAMQINYRALQNPERVFDIARALFPLPPEKLFVHPTYQGSIDVTDIANNDDDSTERGDDLLDRLIDRADDWNWFQGQPGLRVVGVYSEDAPIRATSRKDEQSAIVQAPEAAFAPARRPLTSIAHEVGHLLGRPHASNGCGAEGGENWAPDGQGLLQGVGVDIRRAPYAVRAPALFGTSFWDWMSYCGQIGGGDPQHWISPRNWNALVGFFSGEYGGDDGDPYADSAPAAPGAGDRIDDTLIVRGWIDSAGRARFGKVAPGRGRAIRTPTARGSLLLRATDGAGTVLFETPLIEELSEPEDGFGTPHLAFSAQIPASNVAALEVLRGGAVIGSRRRPAVAPRIELGALLERRGEQLLVGWRIKSDEPRIGVKVDYSANEEPRWKPLFFGMNASEVKLDRRLFQPSRCGRVRVRANDGFNESEVISKCLEVNLDQNGLLEVYVQEPEVGAALRVGGPLYAAGGAASARGPVTDLTWFLGDVEIGRGAAVAVPALPEGVRRLVLRARSKEDGLVAEAVRTLRCAEGSCVVEAEVPSSPGDSPSSPGEVPSSPGQGSVPPPPAGGKPSKSCGHCGAVDPLGAEALLAVWWAVLLVRRRR